MKRMVLGLALAMGLSSVSMIASAAEKPAVAAAKNAKVKVAPAKVNKKAAAQKAAAPKAGAPVKTGGAAASNKMEGGE